MNIDDLTYRELKQIAAVMGANTRAGVDNEMLGKYVIVRCRDAGVHAGVLAAYNDRECVLDEGRRLWYWKNVGSSCSLSGVATTGLHSDSRVGPPVHIHLTENCEIILCTAEAEASIRAAKVNG